MTLKIDLYVLSNHSFTIQSFIHHPIIHLLSTFQALDAMDVQQAAMRAHYNTESDAAAAQAAAVAVAAVAVGGVVDAATTAATAAEARRLQQLETQLAANDEHMRAERARIVENHNSQVG
jgi:hypothetical protein